MRLREKLGTTLAAQVIGMGATALANIIIARRYGPEGQGYMSSFRATVELLQNIGLFGFSQAFIYMINARLIEADWAAKFSTAYGVICLVLGLCVVGLLHVAGVGEIGGYDQLTLVAIVAASAGLLLHGLYRSISLAARSVLIFNIVSIMPAVLALAGYVFWRPADYRVLVAVLGAASFLASLMAAGFLRDYLASGRRWWNRSAGFIRKAAMYGAWSFVPNITVSLVLAGTYGFLRKGGGAEESAGYFSISYLLISTAVLPLNMVLPVLFDIWSKESDRQNILPLYMRLSHLGPLLMAAGLTIGMLLVRPLTLLVFGSKFLPCVTATQIFLVSVYALYENRLLYALLLSIGRPAVVAMGAVVRVGIILIPMALGWIDSLWGAVLLWVAGEYVSMLIMMAVVRRDTRWSVSRIAGVSFPWALAMGREWARSHIKRAA